MKTWFAIVLSLALSSCATPRFEKAWAESVSRSGGDGVKGAWEGSWTSGHNGHEGALRAIVSEGEDPEDLRFWYWAQWGRMKGTFRMKGNSEILPDGSLKVVGEKWLGPAGTYTHRASLTPEQIEAVFGSKRKDHGTFELNRPAR